LGLTEEDLQEPQVGTGRDIIRFDLRQGYIHADVCLEERKPFQSPTNHPRGYLADFARLASQAHERCVSFQETAGLSLQYRRAAFLHDRRFKETIKNAKISFPSADPISASVSPWGAWMRFSKVHFGLGSELFHHQAQTNGLIQLFLSDCCRLGKT
jgi:hypothetical protein